VLPVPKSCAFAPGQDGASTAREGRPVLSLAAWILTGCGVALVGIGVFFLTARPPLLPEDARFMGSTVEHILDAVPDLSRWLRRVF